jgi:hypothetical protein
MAIRGTGKPCVGFRVAWDFDMFSSILILHFFFTFFWPFLLYFACRNSFFHTLALSICFSSYVRFLSRQSLPSLVLFLSFHFLSLFFLLIVCLVEFFLFYLFLLFCSSPEQPVLR